MEEIKIDLLCEELETLNEGKGKPICIWEDEDRNLKITISYKE